LRIVHYGIIMTYVSEVTYYQAPDHRSWCVGRGGYTWV